MSKAYIDCGGSKCHVKTTSGGEWVLPGFNPLLHNPSQLLSQLSSNSELVNQLSQVQEIRYYGAGCGSLETKTLIKQVLNTLFTGAEIRVGHDLDLCFDIILQGKEGIIGILGTGSNAAYYDGEKAIQAVPSLGYILGDEGGGVSIGRRLVSDYYHQSMPSKIRTQMHLNFDHADYAKLIKKVYREEGGNQFLASLTRLISGQFRSTPYVQNLLKSEFELFIDHYILPNATSYKGAISFIGSIAFVFKTELEQALHSRNLELGTVCKQPLDRI